ncbi:DUF4228 domain protein [Senna tora]|uniref:DUF4228 domain protein n=1 Tax=Senna tora TaxID=362788 RepID=A0A834WG44_9FABA|nr:DUF4228 domain protein [Senna tora]
MGNCLKPQASRRIAADVDYESDSDWISPVTEGGFAAKNGGKVTEVKIKITKKELEKLISRMEVKEMRADQVLAKLMSYGGSGYEVNQHQRSWRPALQSIPEVN